MIVLHKNLFFFAMQAEQVLLFLGIERPHFNLYIYAVCFRSLLGIFGLNEILARLKRVKRKRAEI